MKTHSKFVQLAVAMAELPDGFDTATTQVVYALDAEGGVWQHFEHRTKGWGWHRVENKRFL